MKCAGVFTDRALINALEPTHAIYNSWHLGYNQDWPHDELTEIIRSAPLNDGKVYLHQHHLNVTNQQLEMARFLGWYILTFVRHPADVICSMHYWCRQSTLNGHGNHVFPKEDPIGLWGFPRFWRACLRFHMRRWWSAPRQLELYDNCEQFSNNTLTRLMENLSLEPKLPKDMLNVSSNPGIDALKTMGTLTDELLGELYATKEFQRYEAVIFKTKNSTEAIQPATEAHAPEACISEAAPPTEGL